jgi:hypothetical protein
VEQGRAQLREFGGFLIGEGKMVVRYVGVQSDRRPFEGFMVLQRAAAKKKADAAPASADEVAEVLCGAASSGPAFSTRIRVATALHP